METQRSLCSTISTIHNGYYPKQITEHFETAQSSCMYISGSTRFSTLPDT